MSFCDLRKSLSAFNSEKAGSDSVTRFMSQYRSSYGLDFAELPGVFYKAGLVRSSGFDVVVQQWTAPQSRGLCCCVHGYFDHVGLYRHLLHFLLQQGYSVMAFDLPGHGLSSGDAVWIDRFDRYVDVLMDVLAATQQELTGVVGQSTGGAIIAHALLQQRLHVDKVALLAPLLRAASWWKIVASYALLRHWCKRLPRQFSASSHDSTFSKWLRLEDSLQSSSLSVPWVGAMIAAERCFNGYQPIEQQGILIQGSGDETVDWRYNLPVFAQQLPKFRTAVIEGAKHHLVNEIPFYREQVWQALATVF